MFESMTFAEKACVFSRFLQGANLWKIRFERIASTASVATLAKNAHPSLTAETRIFAFWDSPKPLFLIFSSYTQATGIHIVDKNICEPVDKS